MAQDAENAKAAAENASRTSAATDTNTSSDRAASSGAITHTNMLLRFLQGSVIGLGAVLPGISGGVLCVVFGVYRTFMEFLSSPIRSLRRDARTLLPLVLGFVFGFMGISKALGFLLDRYPDPSVCLFVGLISGMIPSLYREAGAQGRSHASLVAMGACFAVVFTLLVTLQIVHVDIEPSFGWNLFCGFCMGLSIIAPGMSFSTLTMPLGLYTQLVTGIGNFDPGVLVPVGIGLVATLVLLSRAVTSLMDHHYSVAFHGIIGIVVAATIVIVPFGSFVAGVGSALVNTVCLVAGVAAALALGKFNTSVNVPDK